MTYGKIIHGLKIDGKSAEYPVLNERDARAAAGIMFVLGIAAFVFSFFEKNYIMLNFVIISFALEFLIRIIDFEYAPFYNIGRFIVRKQRPDYTGAIQKRFAWSLGLMMAGSMIIIGVILKIRGALPFTFCMACLSLLWLETSFGICVGCKIYHFLMKKGIIKEPDVMPACPGGACEYKPGKKK